MTEVGAALPSSSETASSALAVGAVVAATGVASTLVTDWFEASRTTAPSPVVVDVVATTVSGAAISPETSTDALGASVVEGAEGSAMVVTTGVATCSVLVVVDGCSTVAGAGAGSVDEIGSDVELRKRRPVCDCCVVGGVYAGAQPSSVVAVVSLVVVAVVVSPVAGASVAGASACACDTSGSDGIAGGGAPIESSYTGSSGSGFGFAGAGLVVYEFVTTGI